MPLSPKTKFSNDSFNANDKLKRLENACPKVAKKLPENAFAKALKILDSLTYVYNKLESTHFAGTSYYY